MLQLDPVQASQEYGSQDPGYPEQEGAFAEAAAEAGASSPADPSTTNTPTLQAAPHDATAHPPLAENGVNSPIAEKEESEGEAVDDSKVCPAVLSAQRMQSCAVVMFCWSWLPSGEYGLTALLFCAFGRGLLCAVRECNLEMLGCRVTQRCQRTQMFGTCHWDKLHQVTHQVTLVHVPVMNIDLSPVE